MERFDLVETRAALGKDKDSLGRRYRRRSPATATLDRAVLSTTEVKCQGTSFHPWGELVLAAPGNAFNLTISEHAAAVATAKASFRSTILLW